MAEITKLSELKRNNEEKKQQLEDEKKRIKQDISEIKVQKDLQISGLKKQIEEMSNEFKLMLVDTHVQMKNKIQEANELWNSTNTGQSAD